MATAAEIIFVGLCSFVNVRNQNTGTDIPPPSVILMSEKVHKHISFIAWDTNKVTMTGVAAAPLGASTFSFVQLLDAGEELTFNDDHTQLPSVDTSFAEVASFTEYSKFPKPKWVKDYIPDRNKLPLKNTLAGYVEFGGGRLSASRPTAVKYEFTVKGTDPDPAKAKCFAREVHYAFNTPQQGLFVEARSLDGGAKRTMLFTPKGSNRDVQVWMGTSIDPLGDVLRIEPLKYGTGVHFAEFYKSEALPDNVTTDAIPRPVAYDCAGKPVPLTMLSDASQPPKKHHRGSIGQPSDGDNDDDDDDEGDPEVGYCGPDSRP